MLEARVSPITSVLTDDPKTILRATGILSRLWRLTLGELKLDYVKWINNADDYIARCKKEYKDVDLSNTKGNLGKALARDEVTWDVFCKGLSLLKLKNPRLSLLLKHGDIERTIVIDIPFTCNEDRGVLLSKAWKKVKKEFPDKAEDWDKLIGEYGKKQKQLGMNLADSLKSNLTNTLKTRSIMWAVFVKGIEVLSFDYIEIKLIFDMTKGSKEITLRPK